MRRGRCAVMLFNLIRQHRKIDIAVATARAAAIDKAKLSFSTDDEICQRGVAVNDNEILLWLICRKPRPQGLGRSFAVARRKGAGIDLTGIGRFGGARQPHREAFVKWAVGGWQLVQICQAAGENLDQTDSGSVLASAGTPGTACVSIATWPDRS